MCGLLRYVFVLSLSLCISGLIAAANSQTKTPKKPLTGSVSGRITLHGKALCRRVATGLLLDRRLIPTRSLTQRCALLRGAKLA